MEGWGRDSVLVPVPMPVPMPVPPSQSLPPPLFLPLLVCLGLLNDHLSLSCEAKRPEAEHHEHLNCLRLQGA